MKLLTMMMGLTLSIAAHSETTLEEFNKELAKKGNFELSFVQPHFDVGPHHDFCFETRKDALTWFKENADQAPPQLYVRWLEKRSGMTSKHWECMAKLVKNREGHGVSSLIRKGQVKGIRYELVSPQGESLPVERSKLVEIQKGALIVRGVVHEGDELSCPGFDDKLFLSQFAGLKSSLKEKKDQESAANLAIDENQKSILEALTRSNTTQEASVHEGDPSLGKLVEAKGGTSEEAKVKPSGK